MYIHTFVASIMTINEAIQTNSFVTVHQKAIVNLTYTHSWLQLKHTDWLKPYGLSIQQFNILRILRGQFPDPASVNLLIDRMVDKNSNVSRLVEKLRIKKLVIRKPNQIDRRQVDILITDCGLKLLKELDEKYAVFEKQFHHLTPIEAEKLSLLLDKLRNS